MMMRQRATIPKDLVTSLRFNLVEGVNRMLLHTTIDEAHVKVDACARVIGLCHTTADPRLVGQVVLTAGLTDACFHIATQREHIRPGNGRLKALRQKVVVHSKVAQISDKVGEVVTFLAILFSTFHTTMFERQRIDLLLLNGHIRFRTLEQQSCSHHLVDVKTSPLGDIHLFQVTGQKSKVAIILRSKRLTELELHVVHETDRCGCATMQRNITHERYSSLKVRKHNGTILSSLESRTNLEGCFGDYS
mmetsp:Transcript_36727/g.92076  ORF Transcript_36727/g.92076 Transcript_36727/m.92076 type:complete len:248 (-) Transcript_36727:1008-1751(-)